jgi:hypothetical protein
MTVRLAAKMPDGDRNGLAVIAPALVNNPDDTHVAIVVLQTRSLTTDVQGGSTVPTVGIVAIEPVTASGDAREVKRLLRRQFERRTGIQELPLEMERELDALAGDIDLSTGDVAETPGLRVVRDLEELPDDARLDLDDNDFDPGFSDS